MIKRTISKKKENIKRNIENKANILTIGIFVVVLFIAFFAFIYLFCDSYVTSYFEHTSAMYLAFAVITCAYIAGAEKNKNKDKYFLLLIVSTIILSICNHIEKCILLPNAEVTILGMENVFASKKIFSFLFYVFAVIDCSLFHKIFQKRKGKFPTDLLAIALTVATYGLMFTDSKMSVWFDASNSKHFEALGFVDITLFLIYIVLIGMSIYEDNRKASEKFMLVPVALITLAAVITDVANRSSCVLCNVIGVDCLVAYLYMHLNASNLDKYKEEMEDALRRSDLAHSQIQPHFMYNTLASIKSLYRSNPDEAEELLNKFSSYLRTNIDSIDMSEPVLFEDELEHVKTYVDIELIRYSNEERHITVNYDIQDDEFLIPALSIQPFVENAIKYGVRSKKEGIVNISTYFDDDRHVIKIEDNGTGFDVHKYDKNPVEILPNGRKRRHVGIKNVKGRLKTAVNADVVINSEEGKGTTVLIFVPNKKDEEE